MKISALLGLDASVHQVVVLLQHCTYIIPVVLAKGVVRTNISFNWLVDEAYDSGAKGRDAGTWGTMSKLCCRQPSTLTTILVNNDQPTFSLIPPGL